jgi:hypothetical protein
MIPQLIAPAVRQAMSWASDERRRAKAIRFLMNTLLAFISTAVDSCVLTKLSPDALGLCCSLRVGVWGATEQKTGLSTGCRKPMDRSDVT